MNNSIQQNKLETIAGILNEILRWIRVKSKPLVREILMKELQEESDKIAYEQSDGEKTSRGVAEIAGIGKDAITSRWKKWIELGIAEPKSVRGGIRAKTIFSLEDFGIEVARPEDESNKETECHEIEKIKDKDEFDSSIQ